MLSWFHKTLFFRLITPISVFLILTAGWLTLVVVKQSGETIESFRELQAISHARTLANGSMDAILTRDYSLLENWVYAAIPGDDYAYAYITDDEGLILAHSNFSRVGRQIEIRHYDAIEIADTRYDGRAVAEVIQPINLGKGYLGTAHVAYFKGSSFDLLDNEVALDLLVFILLALLLVGVVTYITVRRTTDPIHNLTETIESSSLTNLVPIPESVLNQRDEIGKLASAFRRMQDNLRVSYTDLNEEKSKLHSALTELDKQNTHLETTLNSIGEAVIAADVAGRVQYLNPAAERLLGWTETELKGQPLKRVLDNDASSTLWDDLSARCLEAGTSLRREEQPVLNRTGERIFIEISAAPIIDRHKAIKGLIVVAHDVTRELFLQQELIYKASHDDLTGLFNRMEFNRRLREVVNPSEPEPARHALLFMDLDQFKLVNDTCGHAAGDELLRQVSHIFSTSIREHDILARLGGDEFTIILNDCSPEEAMAAAEKIREAVAQFYFVWENQRFNITTSIGLVTINQQNMEHSRVLSLADAACYAAKHAGRNQIYQYNEDDELLSQHYGEANWISRINQAMAENRLELHFQTIHPLNDINQNLHIEILVRLRDEQGQMIPPNSFIPAAERYNLMPTVDRWIIQSTFEWFEEHPDQLNELACIAVNLSGESLNDLGFPDFVLSLFDRHRIPPAKICFEITETTAIGNLMRARQFIIRMNDMGCHFSLDDFGTGMSSFAYLKTLPVEYLKIDGIFIQNIINDPIDFAMVKAINDIGHMLGQRTVAEFVENEAILDKLRGVGIDYGQGYYFCRPAPIRLLPATLREGNPGI